jgi:hypothetical protein
VTFPEALFAPWPVTGGVAFVFAESTGAFAVAPVCRCRSLTCSVPPPRRAMGLKRVLDFPRLSSFFFASLKIAITLAFVGAVISETIASNEGIGFLMLQASSQFRIPLLFAGVVVIAIMGILTYLFFAAIEQRMTGWATRGQRGTQFAAGS